MTGPTILVLLDSETGADSVAADLLEGHPGARIVLPLDGLGDLGVRTCAAINALAPEDPLVIVTTGTAALLLPAVALSQHASHRRVAEYLLVDPVLPPVSDTWPDARVTLVCEPTTEASLQARLRGWDVLSPDEMGQWQVPD